MKMPFTYRLSRRLAQIHIAVFAVLTLACSDSQDPTAGDTEITQVSAPGVGVPTFGLTALTATGPGNGKCTNEPAGYTALTDQPFDAVPPLSPSKDVLGWQVLTMRQRFSILKDVTSPTGGNVIKGLFPKGAKGGAGPFRLDRPLNGNFGSIYQCFSTKISSNFTANGNSAIKFGFFITPYLTPANGGLNHYINLFPKLEIRLQSLHATLNRNLISSFNLSLHRGEWHTVEVLVVGNTVNQLNGIGRMWVDGNLVLDKTDVQYFLPGQVPKFNKMTWNPTYGGGLNPVPYDIDQMIDGWYISVK